MLGDAALDSLSARLAQFKLTNRANQHELQTLLREHEQLLEDYKALKNATTLEPGKNDRVASDTPISSTSVPKESRDTYALLLVDGNGYVFQDELVKDKEEGGRRAARLLCETVKKFQQEHTQAKSSRIVVRVYADITNLSKQLAKLKVVGLEKRSLMPFAAGFTRTFSGFDFVDSLDEEGTRLKIAVRPQDALDQPDSLYSVIQHMVIMFTRSPDAFEIAVKDTNCSHILFAACHDTSYLPQLTPYRNRHNKITLIQGAGFVSDFHQLNLTIAQLPTLFRSSELGVASLMNKNFSTTKISNMKASTGQANPLDQGLTRHESVDVNGISYDSGGVIVGIPDFTDDGPTANPESNKKTKLCRYFQKGFCRWGNQCNFIHTPEHVLPGAQSPHSGSPTPTVDRANVSSYLPTNVPDGFIALNKDAHRLDPFIRAPTSDEWLTYNARFHKQKPCNAYHLSGTCTNFNCPFDHHPLEVETQHCLEYVLKCSPCPRRGACRDKTCYHGHICQKDGCMGFAKGCKLKGDAHAADPQVASMVPAEGVEVKGNLIDVDATGGAYEGAW